MEASPHLYLATSIDLQRAAGWLADTNARRPAPDRVLMAALFLKSVVCALRNVPELNGSWTDGRSHPNASIHLGVVVTVRAGPPVTPVLRNTERRSLGDLMGSLLDLVRRARTNRLRAVDLGNPTFTVTNLGELGVQAVFPSIVPPQVGAVGFGKVVEQAAAVAGAIVCSPAVTATLAAKEHAVDSHRGARFLATVDRLLQHPETL
jgi:pyruvate dehydrogenase E2 component (dihydrolipoamide acetyltransferase)